MFLARQKFIKFLSGLKTIEVRKELVKDELNKKLLNNYDEEKDKALSIAETLLNNYDFERVKRLRFQYEMTENLKKSKAKTSFKRDKEFLEVF